jgi:hypothetical protein
MSTRFETDDLALATYIRTTGELRFLSVEPADGTERVVFVFDDSDNRGEGLRVAFENDAQCSANGFFNNLKRLRRLMDSARGERVHEQRERTPFRHR